MLANDDEDDSLKNYDSNHAVVMRLHDTPNGDDKQSQTIQKSASDSHEDATTATPPTLEVSIRHQSANRNSLYLNDALFQVGRRGSSVENSFMSSVTFADYGGESFFNDCSYVENSQSLLRWDDHCDDNEEDSDDELECQVNRATTSLVAKTRDDLPKFPQRQRSIVSGKVSVSSSCFRAGDMFQTTQKLQDVCCEDDTACGPKKSHPAQRLLQDGSENDCHPVKPGRKSSMEFSTKSWTSAVSKGPRF